MTEVAQHAQHDFWRPPMQAASEASGRAEMVEACGRCGTEFIVGSRFCHTCGAGRPGLSQSSRLRERITFAQFTGLAERLGLTTAAFIAFLAGILCVLVAAGVGVVFSAQKVIDWQAVQLWRIQWLLGAIAAFVAGCLLKRTR
ncbi:MAG: hypothetical protein WAQ52_16950 [Terriglobales bacterium]